MRVTTEGVCGRGVTCLPLEGKVSAKQTDEVVAERGVRERQSNREAWRNLNFGFAPRWACRGVLGRSYRLCPTLDRACRGDS